MVFNERRAAAVAARLVVRNALSAHQWEAYVHDRERAEASVWRTPPLISLEAWRREAWQRGLARGDDRILLTPGQSAALWRRILGESAAGEGLLDAHSGARWATQARRVLSDWDLDAATLSADAEQADFAAFLSWHGAYARALAEHGWLDGAALTRDLRERASGTGETLALLDLADPVPADRALFAALERGGCVVEQHSVPELASTARKVSVAEAAEELAAAAAWAAQLLRKQPRARVAVVVPDLRRQLERARQALDEALAACNATTDVPVGMQYDPPNHAQPLIGAALCGIELGSVHGSFATLSRWLRSPFFHGEDPHVRGHAARTEAALRPLVAAQLDFLTAYERAGLRARLARDLPELAAKLDAGLGEMRAPGRTATADAWARAWTRGLMRFGWPGSADDALDGALEAWEDALARFAALGPIVGPLTQERALAELRAGLDAPSTPALPLYGVHVLEHVDDVGPGYDAVWVTGLTDQRWPEPARTNPLLPRRLQAAHGMPYSTPADTLARARASMRRLHCRAHAIVFSWPAVVHDYAAQPSPLIDHIEVDASLARAAAQSRAATQPRAPAPARARTMEHVADDPPPLEGSIIEGGARTLDLQARCPIRAFCETRLHAVALDSPARGLSPRAQGIAIHRALELFVRLRPTHDAMRGDARANVSADIRGCVERALGEIFGAAGVALAALFALEHARIAALLETWLDRELERPPFRAVRLEERADIRLGAYRVSCRIDRVDELADGTAVLIDYKTGRRPARPADWFGDRLTQTQLPLYALEVGRELAALLTVRVSGDTVSYRGVATHPWHVSRALRPLPEGVAWEAQLTTWRAQIAELVEEYARGDTRVYAAGAEEARGPYAPLTRVRAELAALDPEADE